MRRPFRCCLCVEHLVFLWFSSAELPKPEYGVCIKCMLKYLDEEDGISTLKMDLRSVDEPVIPWSEKPEPAKDLEDWEDDLFD